MAKNKILIAGGKGAAMVIAQSIIDAINLGMNDIEFCGFINDKAEENHIENFPIAGGISDMPRLYEEGYVFIAAIHKIGGQVERYKMFKDLNLPAEAFFTFIHPKAYVAPNVKLGAGTVVLANASISSGTNIGDLALVMNNVSIGHDNEIGDFCFFTANSCLGSYLRFGKGIWIGLNATILGKLQIGDYAAIGAGSVLTKDVASNELWVGNPAKFHKKVSESIRM